MNRFLCLALCLALSTTALAGVNLYVSPSGDDTWDGSAPEQVKDTTHGPFRTLQKAQQAVRALPRTAGEAITVHLRGGVYPLTETWTLNALDSGTDACPVTWRAYNDEQPIISGGTVIRDWTVAEDGTWSAKFPLPKDTAHCFTQVFVNGQRRPCCRLPKKGFYISEKPFVPEGQKGGTNTQFVYAGDDLQAWEDVSNCYLTLYHSWTAGVHRLKEIDTQKKIVTLAEPDAMTIGYWSQKQRYFIANLRAAFTDAGEWLADYKTGTLHYKPLPGETPENTQVIVPQVHILLHMQGDPKIGQYVEHLHLDGLAFQYSTYEQKNNDGPQAGCNLTAALLLEGVRDSRFTNLDISRIGEYGMWFSEGCRNNVLYHSEIHDLGSGAVRIGGGNLPSQEELHCGNNTVENCFLHTGGRIAPAGIGAIIMRSSYNKLIHNEICDFYYSAVSVGWSWGYAASTANHNLVAYNHLHHIGYGYLSDMGAVYTLGISPGTVIRGNHIHDVFAHSYGGWGLYTDEGSTGILLEHNVVYNTKSGGFHQHYGRDNILRNNLFAFAKEEQLIRSREENHSSFSFYNNVVVFDNGRLYGSNWGNLNYDIHDNIYWDTTGKPFFFRDLTLEDWQIVSKKEYGTRVLDPGFVNAEQFDFSLKPGAAAEPYLKDALAAMAIAGLYGEHEWTEKPRHQTFMEISDAMQMWNQERPSVPPPKVFNLSFTGDELENGSHVPNAEVYGETDKASIRVSDEMPAPNCKKSIKFQDADNLEFTYCPFMSFSTVCLRGTATVSFDVYMQSEEALFWHEWRDSLNSYQVGPTLRIHGNGKVTSSNDEQGTVELGTVPVRQWLHVEIFTKLGKESTGDYSLKISTQDGKALIDVVRPYHDRKEWRHLCWIGFVSESNKESSFFIGNLRFKCTEEKE